MCAGIADAASKSIYIEQATEINSIQKEIISISQNDNVINKMPVVYAGIFTKNRKETLI